MRKMVLAALAGCLSTSAMAASELVTNGGFETGDFTGFTLTGNTSYVGVAGASSAPAATIGNYRAYFGTVGASTSIDQIINTVAGQNYTVSFFLENDGGTPNSAQVSFGDTILFSLANSPAFPLTQYTFNAVATGTSTDLKFSFRQDPNYFNLDGISVMASEAPEPASWAMMVGGFGLLGGAMRRRKAAVTFA